MSNKIRGYQLTRGVLCAMKRKPYRSVEDVIRNAKRIAILNDVENPSNIGAIIRSAAAMFVDAVILTPECADPLYRRAARVSVGTVFGMPYTYSYCLTEKENIGAKSYTEGNEMLYNVHHKQD